MFIACSFRTAPTDYIIVTTRVINVPILMNSVIEHTKSVRLTDRPVGSVGKH